MKKLVIRLVGLGKRAKVSEPRYLMGDEAALAEYADELINCNKCKREFYRVEYRSDTCSDCEDLMIKRDRERV